MREIQEFLAQWESTLDPRRPERAHPPAQVLGYGEISTVLSIDHPLLREYALKRMPMFHHRGEVDAYINLHQTYLRHLQDIGIHVPETHLLPVPRHPQGYTVYILQKRLPSHAIGNHLIRILPLKEALSFIFHVLHSIRLVFQYNAAHRGTLALGFDAQISNWAVLNVEEGATTLPREPILAYFDTSTPLLQKNGREQLNPELFLRSAPSFLVWIIRLFFLKDVMTRYYNFRLVVLDLIANFYKEKRGDWVPQVIQAVNTWVQDMPEWSGPPYSVDEVRAYYREDAFIWRFYLAARKLDRRLHEGLGRTYPYILPDNIER